MTVATFPTAANLLGRMPAPSRLWVPLGARTAGRLPAAKIGMTVKRGDPLADATAEGFPTALAPADGCIMAIEPATLLDGREVAAAVLETTGDGDLGHQGPLPDPNSAAAPDLFGDIAPGEPGARIEALRSAGIWADRWTSPDLIAQLHHSLRRPVDTVLCNILDTDRALPLQSILADHDGPALAAGVDLVAKVAGAHRAWVLTDEASPDAFRARLRVAVEKVGAKLVPLRNDYPQSNPTLLLYTILRRRLPADHLPTEVGALVLDAAAAVAVGRFVLRREPMLSVPLTVSDLRTNRVHFLTALVGTPVGDVLAHLGIVQEATTCYGGPPPRDLRVSVSQIVSGAELSVYATAPAQAFSPDPCIRCGWCVEGCPVHIHPAALLEAVQVDDMDLAEDAGLHACIDCGVCSYICPSKLPLLGGIRLLRKRRAERSANGK